MAELEKLYPELEGDHMDKFRWVQLTANFEILIYMLKSLQCYKKSNAVKSTDELMRKQASAKNHHLNLPMHTNLLLNRPTLFPNALNRNIEL